MSFLELSVSCKDYYIDINCDRRIMYIIGDSASGKTSLVDRLRLRDTVPGIHVSCNWDLFIFGSSDDLVTVKTRYNTLFILDELLVSESRSFINGMEPLLISNNNCMIIISRVHRPELFSAGKESSVKGVHFSAGCIYDMFCDGKHHWLEKHSDNIEDFLRSDFDFVITDSYNGTR